jgi:hypothetical protein
MIITQKMQKMKTSNSTQPPAKVYFHKMWIFVEQIKITKLYVLVRYEGACDSFHDQDLRDTVPLIDKCQLANGCPHY